MIWIFNPGNAVIFFSRTQDGGKTDSFSIPDFGREKSSVRSLANDALVAIADLNDQNGRTCHRQFKGNKTFGRFHTVTCFNGIFQKITKDDA